jgi:hypothetical protein
MAGPTSAAPVPAGHLHFLFLLGTTALPASQLAFVAESKVWSVEKIAGKRSRAEGDNRSAADKV